ncbi:DNA mismatch repair protein MutS [bacterium SCSIO 12643]|nr:DNA mismatch repair protein MutS [bacterium SCSIO 12643]
MLSKLCFGPTASERIHNLDSLPSLSEADLALSLVQEYVDIQKEEVVFPRLEFTELTKEIVFLNKKGSQLTLEGFIALLHASRIANQLVKFIKPFEEEYPHLFGLIQTTYYSKEIITPIEKVLDRKYQVRDDASPKLFEIRMDIRSIRKQINVNFDRILKRLHGSGMLADNSESFVNGKRVLAVSASHKRSIPGSIIGSSNNGHVAYIEPKSNEPLHHELNQLIDEERLEINRIFKELTKTLRVHLELIKTYQFLLTELDFVQAKGRLAQKMGALKPHIEFKEVLIDLIEAQHPLLLLANNELEKPTFPQSVKMDKFSRMMVISGPNAGGKSITLKTVGLLQLMFQSGLLIPVDHRSKLGWFHKVLTDIGDNQSIENELSTYSYRLQRMKYFLDVANRKTLLLLDEFGTGSDPELGGALAEVFFENLYNKKCFGVITTHYANIKLKASRLRNAVNASMLFDRESLAPLFELSVGQPGSSFTFEVAQTNGIPIELIDDAKKLLDVKRVEMDRLIAELQKEKASIQQITDTHKKATKKAEESVSYYEDLQHHITQQIQKQQTQIEQNNKFINWGKKLEFFLNKMKGNKASKPFMEDVRKYFIMEKTKLTEATKKAKLKKQTKSTFKPKIKKKPLPVKKKVVKPIEVGSKVRLITGTETGEVLEISGTNATVLFGNFQTKTKVAKLEAI